MSKTRIIATIGPSSRSGPVLLRMAKAGLDVARINFSHSDHEEAGLSIKLVRGLFKEDKKILLLGDLEGHRIRIGKLKRGKPLELKEGSPFRLLQDNSFEGQKDTAAFDYGGPIGDIRAGQEIYIDDGLIALKVLAVDEKSKTLETRVLFGGELKEFKGVNIPGARLHFGGLTEKDRQDISFAASMGMDFIAQSFVRSAGDIVDVKKAIAAEKRSNGLRRKPLVIAKIENWDGIRNIDAIIKVSDGIMIARGDMGVSIPVKEVPFVQKEIISRCNRQKKPVITATQMLESMVSSRLPTRAEVSDVANAVLDGTDYAMLSAETAVGAFPAESVAMMDAIIEAAERWKRCRKY